MRGTDVINPAGSGRKIANREGWKDLVAHTPALGCVTKGFQEKVISKLITEGWIWWSRWREWGGDKTEEWTGHPDGEKSRWKEAIVIWYVWTRQRVVRNEIKSKTRNQSMNGSVSKTKKSELSQQPCLTEKMRTEMKRLAQGHKWKVMEVECQCIFVL